MHKIREGNYTVIKLPRNGKAVDRQTDR